MLDIRSLGHAIATRFRPAPREAAAVPVEPPPIEASAPEAPVEAVPAEPLRIKVTRGAREWLVEPGMFETFGFQHGDRLEVLPATAAAALPTTWGDVNVPIAPGQAIRVPPAYEFFEFKGFRIPVHLITLTGAGPESLDWIGRHHIELYDKFIGLRPDMTLLEIGYGVGRDALQLFDLLNEDGRYIGIDVTRDSIVWCQDNITPKHPNFSFHHFDAENELYNPHGGKTSMDFALPVPDGSVDRIFLASVFTHLFEAEVLHYMRECARVLKPDGQVYATFFLRTPEALEAARTSGTTSWDAEIRRSPERRRLRQRPGLPARCRRLHRCRHASPDLPGRAAARQALPQGQLVGPPCGAG